VVLAGLATLCGFALVWHMWAVAIAAFLATLVAAVAHSFDYDRDMYIGADAVRELEDARTAQLPELA
jgi:cytochrome o ubiquinol oxidase subunit 1